MSHRILIGWAVGATALALVLLGVVIGRNTGLAPARGAVGYDTFGANTSGDDAGAEPVAPAFTVPDIFTGKPTEWRSDTDSETFDGYAILFDPQRREVIIEKCLHRGYVDKDGNPIDTSYEFCHGVLWSNIVEISETDATLRDKSGEVIDLALNLRADGGQPLLSLSFPGHDMVLIPGSKNDLMQTMENTPRMLAEKQAQFEALQAQYRERQRAQAAARSKGENIPAYTLPDREPDEKKD